MKHILILCAVLSSVLFAEIDERKSDIYYGNGDVEEWGRVLWVSNMLGHTDATMTLSKYASYMKRENKSRGAFLEKSVAQNEVSSENGTSFALLKLNSV